MANLNSLTPLRGIAALAIVVFHMVQLFPDLVPNEGSPLYKSALAVDFFFILSGMLMVHVYGHQFEVKFRLKDYGDFMRNRFARIYPLHIATLAVILVAFLLTEGAPAVEGRYSLVALFHNILMTHSPWIDYRSWNFPSWSISAEWHAYLLFPCFMLILGRVDRLGAALIVAVLLMMLAVLTSFPERVSNGPAVFLRLLPSFCGGMLLYRALVSGRAVALGRPWMVAFVAVALAAAIAVNAHDFLIILLFFPLVLSAVQGSGPLIALLNCRPLNYLGDISYSIYMNHAVLMFVWAPVEFTASDLGIEVPRRTMDGVPDIGYMGAMVVMVLIGSMLTYHLIEVPCRKWLRGSRKSPKLHPAYLQGKSFTP